MDLKFVSENELEEKRKRRQEEWERVRRPDQPIEAPEEEYDPRSLYERLQANKIKQQEEFEESRRLKNMVRGINDEEASFLEIVDQTKMGEERNRIKEERDAIEEFRKAITHLTDEEQEKKVEEFKKELISTFEKPAIKKSARNPLANLIKRKDDSEKSSGSKQPDSSKQIEGSVIRKPPNKLSLVAYESDSERSSSDEDQGPVKKLKSDK